MTLDEVIDEVKGTKLLPVFSHPVTRGSEKKVPWMCECGKTVMASPYSVLRKDGKGKKSCGRCNEVSVAEVSRVLNEIGSKLSPKFDHPVTTGSNKRVSWMCECGKETLASPHNVLKGLITSCGKCLVMTFNEANVTLENIGSSLRLEENGTGNFGSNKKITFRCSCGKTTTISAVSAFRGKSKSCGKCGVLTKDEVNAVLLEKGSKLKAIAPTSRGSTVKTPFTCACGNENVTYPYAVLGGNTSSCGKCRERLREWATENLQNMSFPISPDNFPKGGPLPLGDVKRKTAKFVAKCPLCDAKFTTSVSKMLMGQRVDCGCGSGRVSAGQTAVARFIKSLGHKVETEKRVGKLSYDIAVPSKGLLIEFNGLKWHSFQKSKKRDFEKYRNAIELGWNVMMVYEDEWKNRKSQIKNIIKNRVGSSKPELKTRPSKCEIVEINNAVATSFYESFHYAGGCPAKVNLAVTFNGEVIGCASFRKPSRQSTYEWELSRMAGNPKFSVPGVWAKVMKHFIAKHRPRSIVSFSDNRLFTGNVYGKIGFQFGGSVRPDYYWVRGAKRHHKSALRKREDEKTLGTETELREREGYAKIWDYGKKRWVLERTLSESVT